MNWTLVIFVIWNVVVAFLYGVDKLRSRRGMWRIRESALIVPAFLFANIGAMLGMIIFNHKTSKIKFRIAVPLSMVADALILVWIK